MRTLIVVAGTALLLAILHDAFEVMLLPRRVKSRLRIVRVFFRSTWWLWSNTARRIRSPERRHIAFSLYGPLSIVALLIVWAIGLVTGFGFLQWSVSQPENITDLSLLPNQLYFSGVTFFTLGYGDLVPHTPLGKLLAVMEAGTGLGFLATVIGYLPVLYQLFARREAKVIMLDAAAGSPPAAVTLLTRHADGESMDELDVLLRDWQQWVAELLESQLSYPMLAFYRSQHDNQSWLAALTTIMDGCALLMVGCSGVRTFRARLTFSTARQAVIEMGRVFQVGPLNPGLDRLPSDRWPHLSSALENSGLVFSDPEHAEESLAAFRNTYEPFLNGLSLYLVLPLPEWLAGENQLDNWQNSPRGRSARDLIGGIHAKPE